MKLDGQRDRRTDRQIVHYTAAAEWDPDQFYFQLIQGSGGISYLPMIMMFYYPGKVKGVYVHLKVIRKPFNDTEKLIDKVKLLGRLSPSLQTVNGPLLVSGS